MSTLSATYVESENLHPRSIYIRWWTRTVNFFLEYSKKKLDLPKMNDDCFVVNIQKCISGIVDLYSPGGWPKTNYCINWFIVYLAFFEFWFLTTKYEGHRFFFICIFLAVWVTHHLIQIPYHLILFFIPVTSMLSLMIAFWMRWPTSERILYFWGNRLSQKCWN